MPAMPAVELAAATKSSSGWPSVLASRGSGPASACDERAISTERAIGPIRSSVQLSNMVPWSEIRPKVTLSPTSPLKAEGMRTEPPVSLPMPAGARRAATATPVPLEEPPGVRWVLRSHGFQGAPISGLVPQPPKANSTMCVLPSGTMPAASSRSTVAEVSVATRCASICEPPVPMRPLMSQRSLMAIGRPCRAGSGRPALRAASAASASARASLA